jgi:hypothetical protein
MSNKFLDCYMRVSSNTQRDEGNSLSVQEDMGREVSKKLKLTFRPHMEGSRSSTIHYREVLEELKYKISTGEVKNIWIQDKSRLFRDMTDGMLFRRDYLEKYRITLFEGISPTRLDLDSPEEELFYTQLMSFHQYENRSRTRKSQFGKIYKLKHQSPTKPIFLGGTSLFGYINIQKEWTIEKTEAKSVRFIFNAYEKGSTIKEIKNLLDKDGVKPRRTGNGLWNTGTLHKMLMNKTYTGIHSINQYEASNETEYNNSQDEYEFVITIGKDRERKYKKVIDTFHYKVPKIINVGQFNRVQRLLNKNFKNHNNNKKHFSLLEDYLVCECGTSMGSRHLKTTSSLGYKVDTRTYYCLSSHYDWKAGNDRVCINKKSLQMDALNEYVLGFVKEKVSKSHILKDKFKKEILEDKFQRMKDIQGTEKSLELKLQRIQKEIEDIENNIVEMEVSKGLGKVDKSIVSKIVKRYGEELESRKVLYESIEKQIDDLGQDKNWLNWVEKYGETLELKTSNEEKQKDFLKGVLKSITIKSEYDKNRDGKEVQKGHSVEFRFKLKIVDDEYQVISDKTKPRNYRVIDGKDKERGAKMRFVSKRNRSKKKV